MCEIRRLTLSVCDFSAQSAMESRFFIHELQFGMVRISAQKSFTELTAPKSSMFANFIIPA